MHPELQYLNTLKEILGKAKEHENRTGVNTHRVLGIMHKYDFKHGFPLFTTKRVWFKGVKIELLWFLRGDRNIKYLVDNGVGIWTDDAYRVYKEKFPNENHMSKEEFVQAVKDEHEECRYTFGDIGPVYGVQWRSWEVAHPSTSTDGRHAWVDQIENLIEDLKNNPNSRRHIISAWNVADIGRMGLPPCHVMAQFTIDDGRLWCHMYQRSGDGFLGIPYNVSSYSLLTYMIAQICGLKPGGFIHTVHDFHIYSNHIDAVNEQLSREPREFPKLLLNPDVDNIDNFGASDIKVAGYNPHDTIKAELNVG